MIERVLIPLDGSELAQAILAQARVLILHPAAEIFLVRAVSVPPDLESRTVELLSILKAQAEKHLESVARELSSQGARVRCSVRVGSAADAILDVAAEERASLIAMTTHGRTGLERWTLGSVAEKVVRASRVPVLLTRSFRRTNGTVASTGGETLSFGRILVPADGSPASVAALAPTLALARLFGSEVIVLHVETPPLLPGTEMSVLPSPLPPTPSLEDPVTVRAAARFEEAGLRVRRLTVRGDPAGQILDQAGAQAADLIAMSTHGRSGFTRLVLGSVAERVLRHSDVPVYLVRSTKKEGARGKSEGKAAASPP